MVAFPPSGSPLPSHSSQSNDNRGQPLKEENGIKRRMTGEAEKILRNTCSDRTEECGQLRKQMYRAVDEFDNKRSIFQKIADIFFYVYTKNPIDIRRYNAMYQSMRGSETSDLELEGQIKAIEGRVTDSSALAPENVIFLRELAYRYFQKRDWNRVISVINKIPYFQREVEIEGYMLTMAREELKKG